MLLDPLVLADVDGSEGTPWILDHGYWYLHGDPPKGKERKRLYIADWRRIRLIAEDPEMLRLTKSIREPAEFTDALAGELLKAFTDEIGTGGIKLSE